MSSQFYPTDGLLGVDIAAVRGGDDSAQFKLGTTVRLSSNKTAIYVYFNQTATYSSSSAVPIALSAGFSTSASAGGYFAYGTHSAGKYGWVVTSAQATAI